MVLEVNYGKVTYIMNMLLSLPDNLRMMLLNVIEKDHIVSSNPRKWSHCTKGN